MSDEREGCPSASSIGRLQLCPGSWEFEKKFDDVESAWATEGTIRHEMIADPELKVENIKDPEQRFVVSRARQLTEKARQDSIFDTEDTTVEQEKRYWLRNETGAKVLSGKFDYAEYGKKVGLVLDYKTLSGYQVNAYENLQLRVYAVLLAEKHNLESVYVSLVQPLGIEAYSIDMLGKKDLRKVRREILDILNDALNPSAQRRSHPNACKWCRGLAHCPEVRGVMDKVVGVDIDTLEEPLEIERLIAVAQIAQKWADRLLKWVKERLGDDEDFLPNFKLRSSGKIKYIDDSRRAVDQLLRYVDPSGKKLFDKEELLGAMKVSLPELTKLYSELTGESKGARKKVEEILNDVIKEKDKAPALAKAKS